MKFVRFALALAVALGAGGCTGMVADLAGDALSGGGQTFASDDDPELVRDALPFALKTMEGLLEGSPENEELLLSLASGFAQYAYAFVQADAEALDPADPKAAKRVFSRAARLFARARRYGLRGLEARHPGFSEEFGRAREAALARLDTEDVPYLYWTAAAWAAQISVSKTEMNLVGELAPMEALMNRALALDEAFDGGAIHEFFISYDGGRGESSGGSVARARAHFERARELSQGQKLGPLVTWAEVVSVQAQDRKRFDELLDQVLAFDADQAPRYRLANLLAQQRARRLRERASDLFLEE
ncbi:MAG TPA: TRAP transporter TatT component family protein [Myxococcota bacterium]|nr:TRAP transporter TatT component family protein [Myxococcota bacterium]HRY92283.1 TRAP transporter TatT component family protein [Myxococcota bacterium]HSA21978.1 TRAP transporter TatT component family protein [Myxococcota bacterium]